MKKILFSLVALFALTVSAKEVPIRFGDMEHWTVRYIKESSLLGGKTKTLYALAPTDTIGCEKGNVIYDFKNTCWGVSNAYAAPSGIAKAANTTQPERRGNGWCARLDTRLETVKVLGMININVAIAGTLFLGKVYEPAKDVNDPYSIIEMGIPFTGRPKAVMLDYKAKISSEKKLTKATGFSPMKEIDGHDEAEVYVFLQKRWEDENGQIHAVRIATTRYRITHDVPEWQNNFQIPIYYGDITKEPFFKKYMGLFPDGGQFKARNSKGKMVLVQEDGWDGDATPTHIIMMITSGSYPAFYGHCGNSLWVDNVKFVY